MSKIIHLSDTHLGYSDYDKINKSGVNIREQDFYDAFKKIVDDILELKPESVIHTGDFFHRPSPTNRAIIFCIEQLQRLEKANIPIIILAGNHETPKTIYTSPILEVFNSFDNIYPFFMPEYTRLELNKIVYHGIPHIFEQQEFHNEVKKIKPVSNRTNILLLHTSVSEKYRMLEFGEMLFPEKSYSVLKQFDYVALGHWHNFKYLSSLGNVYYSGSTERLSASEIDKDKGYNVVDIKTRNKINVTFKTVETRSWQKVTIENCSQKDIDTIKDEIITFQNTNTSNKPIISLIFNDIEKEQVVDISNKWIQETFSDAMIVLIKKNYNITGTKLTGNEMTIGIEDLFKNFIRKQSGFQVDKEKDILLKTGLEYIEKYNDSINEE